MENRFKGTWNGIEIQRASWDLDTYVEDFDSEAELPVIVCNLVVRYLTAGEDALATFRAMQVGMRDFYLADPTISALLGKRYHRILAPENESPPYVVYFAGGQQYQNVGGPSNLVTPAIRHVFAGIRTADGVLKIDELFTAFYALTV